MTSVCCVIRYVLWYDTRRIELDSFRKAHQKNVHSWKAFKKNLCQKCFLTVLQVHQHFWWQNGTYDEEKDIVRTAKVDELFTKLEKAQMNLDGQIRVIHQYFQQIHDREFQCVSRQHVRKFVTWFTHMFTLSQLCDLRFWSSTIFKCTCNTYTRLNAAPFR